MALITGFLLRKMVLAGKSSPLVMELPPYRWPSIKNMWKTTWHRLKRFILKAGALIIPLCAVIGMMGAFKTDPESPIAMLGRSVTPLFAPMGIKEDNWPATVGLLTGVLAKEVVVGTLNALYLQEDEPVEVPLPQPLSEGLKQAVLSIDYNWQHLTEAFQSPLYSNVPEQTMQARAMNSMVQRFGGPIAAFAYLLFVLLYFPCVSVVATMAKELNKTWAIFSVVWTTGIAYVVSVLFYQSATFTEHPLYSVLWITGLVCVLIAGYWGVKKALKNRLHQKETKSFPTPILIVG